MQKKRSRLGNVMCNVMNLPSVLLYLYYNCNNVHFMQYPLGQPYIHEPANSLAGNRIEHRANFFLITASTIEFEEAAISMRGFTPLPRTSNLSTLL